MTPLLVFLLLGGSAAGSSASPQSLSQASASSNAGMEGPFDYDPQLPLDIQEAAVDNTDAGQIHYLSYASPAGGRVPALLVVPHGGGPFPAVVFLHWGLDDKYEFLTEALQIAPMGFVSIMIDAPFRRPEYQGRNAGAYVQTVIDLRRAIDLLSTRSEVDPTRIGFVGHSYGATWGGVLAGVEKRVQAYVLMCGHPEIGQCETCGEPVSQSLWASQYIGNAAPAALYFQFALHDAFITVDAADLYYRLASEPKFISWYDATHALNLQAQSDRITWLGQQLASRPEAP